MGKRNRVYGLMVGITIGFAFWGGIQKPSGVMTGKPSELSEESEQQNPGIITTAAEKTRRGYFPPDGQYNKDHDLYSGTGERQPF